MGDIYQIHWCFESESRFIPSMFVVRDPADEATAIDATRRHAALRRPDEAIEIVKVEVWRKVPGMPTVEVSTLGGIRYFYKGLTRSLKPQRNSEGYLTCTVYIKGQGGVTVTIHRLIALAFLGEPSEGEDHVDHLDGDKTNNKIDNLQWVSPAENTRRYYARRRASESGGVQQS